MTLALIFAAFLWMAFGLYRGHGYVAWVGALVLCLAAWVTCYGALSSGSVVFAVSIAALSAAFGIPVLRKKLVSASVMSTVRRILPDVGETERIALEAGSVGWDGELFSGDPDWQQLLDFKSSSLSKKEQEFLDGPVEEFCRIIDDWEITQLRDLPDDAWSYLKRHGFFGMIIPEEHGGLGFSALAQSAVVAKLTSRSVAAAVVVMVPNSLGPGELLLSYGTPDQKKHYLPRLASGDEIPCFALTEPTAGSDAASVVSQGVVCTGRYEGKEVLGLRLNFAKRYITLAPVATVIGLAFQVSDPDGLLGDKAELGITCALLPRRLKGLDIGSRHDPMGIPFPNGPIFGKDVFIPLDFVIGGKTGIGQGWRMLMECLAAGRSISLPAQSVGAVQLAARTAGAYATVREQFGMPIGRFEGIEEPLARIAGHAYCMDAARRLTCGFVDAGQKPSVPSAIVKAYLTQGMRQCMSDAMDIQAGAGICRGPRNILGRGYVGVPIAITVEGANILTRSMIVFGQGAIRCHPFVQDEMSAVSANDLEKFDKALFGHLNFIASNAVKSLWLGVTGGRLARAPVNGVDAHYYRQLSRYSASFALLSDVALVTIGGSLKRREKISGRFADALAWMYMGSAALKRFHDEGRREEDRELLQWCMEYALFQVENALAGVLANLPARSVARIVKPFILPFGLTRSMPSDALGTKVAGVLIDGDPGRERLTGDIFVPEDDAPGLGLLERAAEAAVAARPITGKLRKALQTGTLERQPVDTQVDRAVKAGVIDAGEKTVLELANSTRNRAIQVDWFDVDTYKQLR